MSLKNKFITLMAFVMLVSCSITPPKREIPVRKKPESNIKKLKRCVDDFMREHGVDINDAFSICEKIYRR